MLSTHSSAKAAGPKPPRIIARLKFQLTAARRRLANIMNHTCIIVFRFQLTAARRRLGDSADDCLLEAWISPHSRAKAAGGAKLYLCRCQHISTHSRAKAAGRFSAAIAFKVAFQLTAARRRLGWVRPNCSAWW